MVHNFLVRSMKNPNLYTIESLKPLMMMARLMFLLLPLFFLAPSCDDDDTILPTPETDVPGLPPATQTGAGTFGCLVDGEPWVAKSAPFASGSTVGLRVTYYPDWNGFVVRAYDNNSNSSVSIHLSYVNTEGAYEIDNGSHDYLSSGMCWRNEVSEDTTFFAEISKIDFDQRILSGTFHYYTDNEDDSCPGIEITEGRFDATF